MKIDGYNFFFHPLHESHSRKTQAFSVITTIALTLFSCGTYLLLFGGVHVVEGCRKTPPPPPEAPPPSGPAPTATPPPRAVPPPPVVPDTSTLLQTLLRSFTRDDRFVGTEALKAKLKSHLQKLQKFASEGKWQHLQTHTWNNDSGFDWWMFPSDTRSSKGNLYRVSAEDVAVLKADPEFMQAYRAGVILVAKSWGWDLENDRDITNASQKWARWTIRLEKMLYSLRLFGQDDLRKTLSKYVNTYNLLTKMEPWAQECLWKE